jgi:hypothetical protein
MISRITFMPSPFVFPVPLLHHDAPSRAVPDAPVPATSRKSLRAKVLLTSLLSEAQLAGV